MASNLKPVKRRLHVGGSWTKFFAIKRNSRELNSNGRNEEESTICDGSDLGRRSVAYHNLSQGPKDSHRLESVGRGASTILTLETKTAQEPQTEPRQPPSTIPELSHLVTNNAPLRLSLEGSPTTPASQSIASVSAMRRHAKTPVFRVGQLEKSSARGINTALDGSDGVKSAVESHRSDKVNDGSSITRPDHCQIGHDSEYASRHSFTSSRGGTSFNASRSSFQTGTALTSLEGTVAGGEESFRQINPQPPPLVHRHRPSETYQPLRLSDEENLRLQICVDLLTRELAPAFASQLHRSNRETSALQVWTMIEAYERLRDQLIDTGYHGANLEDTTAVFDSWLAALHVIHRSFTRDDVVPRDPGVERLNRDVG